MGNSNNQMGNSNKRMGNSNNRPCIQGEIERLRARVRELEVQVVDRAALEAEVVILTAKVDELTGNTETLEDVNKVLLVKEREYNDEKAELEVEVAILKEKVDELTGNIETLEELNQILLVKERQYNDELQEARAVLIQVIRESSNLSGSVEIKRMGELGSTDPAYNDLEELGESSNSQSAIGIKRMGDLDLKPFRDTLKDICSSSSTDQVSDQAIQLCSFWEQMLKDPLWHPFKITLVDGKHQELIDEEDKLLQGLKNSWGEEAYSAVVNALVELNEYAPSARYPVQELWNFEENRRATAMEGIVALARRLRKYHPTNTASGN